MIQQFVRLCIRVPFWVFIFAIPILTLIVAAMPLFDWADPWDDAVEALHKENLEGLRWMVGYVNMSENSRYEKSRAFVVLPSVLTKPTVYIYSEGTHVTKGLKTQPYGAFGYLAGDLVLVLVSCFVCIPKLRNLYRNLQGPNHSVQPTPPRGG